MTKLLKACKETIQDMEKLLAKDDDELLDAVRLLEIAVELQTRELEAIKNGRLQESSKKDNSTTG